MKKNIFAMITLIWVVAGPYVSNCAQAEDGGWTRSAHVVSPGAGYAEVFGDDPVAFWGIEFRPGFRFYHIGTWFFWGAGGDETRYAAAGLLGDLSLNDRWMITPAFGVGHYRDGANGPDLGHDAEFRSSIEVSYGFKNGHRFGLMLAHLSNGSLSEVNPGTESLQINWLIPLGP